MIIDLGIIHTKQYEGSHKSIDSGTASSRHDCERGQRKGGYWYSNRN